MYLGPDAPEDKLHAAVEAFGLAPVLARLGGLDAPLAPGGGGLSAAERQLVALARGWLSPARPIILDEATCHLDPSAEASAERAIAARGDRLVVIAHRMPSALRAQRVLLLDCTRAWLDTHAGLLGSSALYADLMGHCSGAAV